MTVSGGPAGCSSSGQKLANPGFESGASSWTSTSGVIELTAATASRPGPGTYLGLAGRLRLHAHRHPGPGRSRCPRGCSSCSLTFWLHIDSAETTSSVQYDKLNVQVLQQWRQRAAATLATLLQPQQGERATARGRSTWPRTRGQTIQIKFTGTRRLLVADVLRGGRHIVSLFT